MMRLNYLNVVAAIAVAFGATSDTFAGFTAQTGLDLVVNNDSPPLGGNIGDSFAVGGNVNSADSQAGGTFIGYVADTPADPQLTGGDLNFYRYNLTGTIDSVVGNVANYSGSYLIFYDLDLDGEPNEGLTVSSGTLSATAVFDPVLGETATFAGTLTQTSGPNNPAFADLSYNGSPLILTGLYTDSVLLDGPSPTGTLTATLRQNAVAVPEPASFSLLGASLIGLSFRRRMN